MQILRRVLRIIKSLAGKINVVFLSIEEKALSVLFGTMSESNAIHTNDQKIAANKKKHIVHVLERR